MKTTILKFFAPLVIFFLVAAGVQGQTMNVSWTDYGSPSPVNTDFYEISWIVFKNSPFTTYPCSPSSDIANWNTTSKQIGFSCTVPDAGQIYRVEVAIKRRDTNYNVVAAGRNVTGYMTASQLAGTFSIHVDLY